VMLAVDLQHEPGTDQGIYAMPCIHVWMRSDSLCQRSRTRR
jgi:hypothetical protein